MNSLDLITKLYKPYRITKKGKCTIINSMDGDFVIKEKNLAWGQQMGTSDWGQGGGSSAPGSGEIVQGQFMCENITPINLPEPTELKTNHIQKRVVSPQQS